MLLRQLTYSACGPFKKTKRKYKNFKKMDGSMYIYPNELDKSCFQHEMAYTYFQYLATKTAFDKVLLDKAPEIVSNPKHDKYQHELASMVCKFFIKNLLVVEKNL